MNKPEFTCPKCDYCSTIDIDFELNRAKAEEQKRILEIIDKILNMDLEAYPRYYFLEIKQQIQEVGK